MNKKIIGITNTQRVVEQAMLGVINYIKSTTNPTSEEAHQIIDTILKENDCESPESHIVAGGNQSVDPHSEGTGLLKENEAIVIDIYPRSNLTGYFADMTRTICIGEPSSKLQDMYNDVLEAQNLAIDMLGPGVSCESIQKSVEDFFLNKGYKNKGTGHEFRYEEGFVHGVGHGVSKILHDKPRIGRDTTDVLKVGDVVTIEPGLYYYGIGGIRIEDMLLIKEVGAEKITDFSYDFIYKKPE